VIVSRGLGLPERGLIVAGGLGISDGSGVIIGHLAATLTGAGTLAGTLGALGHLNALIAGTGTLTGANATALADLEATLAGAGTLTGSFTEVGDLVAHLSGSGAITDADLTAEMLEAAMRVVFPTATFSAGSPSSLLVVYSADSDLALLAWSPCCEHMGARMICRSTSAALTVYAPEAELLSV
jgi:hypothetical protein